MSKRTLVLQSAGSLIGLACLNLALAPTASAYPTTNISNGSGACTSGCGNMSNGTGGNMSNGTGGMCTTTNGCGGNMSHGTGGVCTTTNGCGGNMSHGTGGNMSNGTGGNMSQGTGGNCKDNKCTGGNGGNGGEPRNPFDNGSTTSGTDPKRGDYIIGKNSVSQFGGDGKGGNNYAASSAGLSKQMMELLNAASNAYAEASARLAAIQSQTAPAKKDEGVRYSRVADANADCGCNASAAAPDNSVELAAAKKAEAEAAASLAKAQQQAREFLEAQKKNNLANGTQFTPIW
jgi:hypothetical protein